MLFIDLTLADTRILGEANEFGDWSVKFFDCRTGRSHEKMFTCPDFAKLIAVAISGDDSNPAYEEVLPLVADIPVDCRPIP